MFLLTSPIPGTLLMATQVEATAVLIEGKAYIYRSYGIRIKMKRNREVKLSEGDMIKTKKNTEVSVNLPDGSSFLIEENSSWQYTSEKYRFHSLLLGVMKVVRTGNKIFKTVTPVVAAGVRGTQFTLAVAPEGSTYIAVEEGEVILKNPMGLEQNATGGQTLVVSSQHPEQVQPSEIENPFIFYGKYRSLVKEDPESAIKRMNTLLEKLESAAEEAQNNTTKAMEVYPFLKSATLSYSEVLSSKIGKYLKLEREQYAQLLKKMQEIKLRQKLLERQIQQEMENRIKEYQRREKEIMKKYR